MRLVWGLLVVTLSVSTVSASPQEPRRDARPKDLTADQARAREHHRLGRELMREERFPEAIEEFRQAVRLDPDLTMAHYDLGRARMAVREFPDAVRAYSRCRDSWLKFADELQKGSFEADAAREDKIRELRDRIRELQRVPAAPGSAQAARIQMEITRTENLIQSLDRSRSRGRSPLEVPAELSLALGSAYFRSSQMEDAEREYKAALAVQPKLGEAHNNLAVVYLMQGRFAEAKEAVKRAEKAGFRVDPGLKRDIDTALKQK
jgi:tetratricopeptide (TPR) repeat protein